MHQRHGRGGHINEIRTAAVYLSHGFSHTRFAAFRITTILKYINDVIYCVINGMSRLTNNVAKSWN